MTPAEEKIQSAVQKRQIFHIALSALLLVGICVLLFIIFRKVTDGSETALYKFQMEQLGKTIAARDSAIVSLRRQKQQSDSALFTLRKDITEVNEQISVVRTSLSKMFEQYEKIPSIIRNYNRDELRREFTNPKD